MLSNLEENIFIDGPAGVLEAIFLPPKNYNNSHDNSYKDHVAILCHPHPLHQGTMHNKVITTLAKTFCNAGIASVRFNYRGVGKSRGSFGNFVGEIEDCLAVREFISAKLKEPQIWLAGFSFGAYIAASVAQKINPLQLITIAPAVNHNADFYNLNLQCPILVIQGEDDETVPSHEVYLWYEKLSTNKTMITIPQAGHFFHGKLVVLQQEIARHFGFDNG